MLKCGTALDVPGFGYPDSNGVPGGMDVDYCKALAAAVLGACLLLARLADWVELDLLRPLRGAGAMTLSLYTAHVCVMASLHGHPLPSGWSPDGAFWAQALAVRLVTAFSETSTISARPSASKWVRPLMPPPDWPAARGWHQPRPPAASGSRR